MPHLWIAELIIPPGVAQHIAQKHQLTTDEVRDAVQCVAGLPYESDDDAQRGLRYVVTVYIRARRCLVVIKEVVDPMGDVYVLRTAFPD